MSTLRPLALAAVACLALGAGPAHAAWNNVFQACCNNCRSAPSTSYLAPTPVVAQAAPACPAPCPPQVSYVQRSYYQPVISYKTTTYYEPVTTMQTSYYYEPYTAYKSVSFYDPCTGCKSCGVQPYTAYRLRSQCNAVQSYVQRNALTPVTNYQQVTYYEQVACAPACPPACPTPCATPTAPAVAAPAVAPPPAASDGATLPPTNVPPAAPPAATESRSPPLAPPAAAERQFDPQNSSFRKPAPAVPVRPSRVASYTPAGSVEGRLVHRDYVTPRANAEVRFVGTRGEEVAKTDAAGRFAVSLPAGEWQVFLPGADGASVYHSRLEVRDTEKRDVIVVSR